jgi:putative addiction module component (TIGR02574 family)
MISLDLNRTAIMKTQLLQQASALDIDEQIELVEAIWTGIVSRGLEPSLTESQKLELDRRLADHLANPSDVIAWDDVKEAALAKIR